MSKLVSIIIPTYNRAYLIGETLESILAQNYKIWECIIVDDGSNDNTATLIDEYVKKDNRFQYHQRPVDRIKGANACRNYGFELSKGEYIKWFDSDDIMHPDFLQKQVLVLEQNVELDFCACFAKKFNIKINDISEDFYPEDILEENAIFNFIVGKLFFLTPSTMWRREIILDKELFDETLSNAHETDFNFRRLIEGLNFRYYKDFLFYVRRGHQSIDSECSYNVTSLQSQFDYFQKVYFYLNSNKNIPFENKNQELKKYVFYRQILLFYQIRLLVGSWISFKNPRLLFKNISKIKLPLLTYFKIYFGIVSVLFLKKGFSIIHLKKFDIRMV